MVGDNLGAMASAMFNAMVDAMAVVSVSALVYAMVSTMVGINLLGYNGWSQFSVVLVIALVQVFGSFTLV